MQFRNAAQSASAIAAALAAVCMCAAQPQPAVSACTAADIDAALAKGEKYLYAAQADDGHWSDPHMPALTALPLWALIDGGRDGNREAALKKAVAFILSTQRDDGGFYVPKPGRGGSGLGNYNTSVCLSALFESGPLCDAGPLLLARRYIAGTQLSGDDTMAGGFGYDRISRRRYADLSNTAYALDAMRRTESLEEHRTGARRVDVDWDKAVSFVAHLMKSDGPEAGGAAYNDRTPQAGVVTNNTGRVHLRAYGSMTYAAVLSLCHAKLDRGDPRVRLALDYCSKNWTVDENPGMGRQGLYYFYDIMARSLSAANVRLVGGHDWRKELAAKIVSLQRPDGSWANDNNRFWEADETLCTSFAMLALRLCREPADERR